MLFKLAVDDGGNDSYIASWRAYYKALEEAGIYLGGDPLQVPETGTTVRIKDGKRHVQDGPYADTKEQLGGFAILELPTLDEALKFPVARLLDPNPRTADVVHVWHALQRTL